MRSIIITLGVASMLSITAALASPIGLPMPIMPAGHMPVVALSTQNVNLHLLQAYRAVREYALSRAIIR